MTCHAPDSHSAAGGLRVDDTAFAGERVCEEGCRRVIVVVFGSDDEEGWSVVGVVSAGSLVGADAIGLFTSGQLLSGMQIGPSS